MKVKAGMKKCKNCIFNKDNYCRVSTNVTWKDYLNGDKYKQCKFVR